MLPLPHRTVSFRLIFVDTSLYKQAYWNMSFGKAHPRQGFLNMWTLVLCLQSSNKTLLMVHNSPAIGFFFLAEPLEWITRAISVVIEYLPFFISYSQRKPVLDRQLFHFRQNMRERTKEYRKELEEMQLRMKDRPYLFEQVTKVTGQSSRMFVGDRIHYLWLHSAHHIQHTVPAANLYCSWGTDTISL